MSVVNIPAHNEKSPFASMKRHNVAVRVPDFAAAKRWYVELFGNGQPGPIPKPAYQDLGDGLRLAGFHHFCLNIASDDQTVAELRRRLVLVANPWGNVIELAQVVA
jgi:glyoxylase I family protein